MDGAAASAIKEDVAGDKPRDGDTASGNNASPSAEDTADLNQCSIVCEDCGLRFTHWDVFKTHLHQHALEDEEEEEEEAQTGDDTSPAAELDSGKVEDGENAGGDADGSDMSSSLQPNPSGFSQGVDGGSAQKRSGKIHACLICGKVYTYLVSFRKHQMLHEKPSSKEPESSVLNLNKYHCPECGMSFIRRARLLGHMRVHRRLKTEPPRCDQCDKDFISVKSWMSHVDLHKRKPFWCSSCARGFTDKRLLDKHLRRHNLRDFHCNICFKSFGKYQQLRIHYNTHTIAKPFQCTLCGKGFSQAGNLHSHRKMHLRVYVGSSGMHLGSKNTANIAKKQAIGKKRLLARVKVEREKDTDAEELPRREQRVKKNETGKPREDAVFGRHANPEVLDCGEPVRHAETLEPEAVRPQTTRELNESESQETDVRSEHKDWECVECYMGFDEVAKLHLHYIKHATGELPMPHYDSEG